MKSSKLIRIMVLGLLLGFFVAGMTILTSNTKKQVPPTELQEDNEKNYMRKNLQWTFRQPTKMIYRPI